MAIQVEIGQARPDTRFCGWCQQYLPNTIELHHCVSAPQEKRYEWQCDDCGAWYEPQRGLPGHGHVCKASRRPVNTIELVERLVLPKSAMKLLAKPKSVSTEPANSERDTANTSPAVSTEPANNSAPANSKTDRKAYCVN